MKKVDFIFRNAILLTMDKSMRIYDPGAVAVEGDHVVAVGI